MPRSLGDGVASVERKVGFIRAELLFVVSHMTPPVRIKGNKGGVGNEPLPNKVIQFSIGQE